MVNFKGGGHQGEHKRALAAQGGEGGERAAVSKLEKLALRKEDAHGPGCARSVVNEGGLALLVVVNAKMSSVLAAPLPVPFPVPSSDS